MGAKIAWTAGGDGELVSLDGDRTTWRSSRSFPPGSRPDGALEGGDAVRLKVHGSRREESGAFVVVARLLDASRELRARLAASVAPTAP